MINMTSPNNLSLPEPDTSASSPRRSGTEVSSTIYVLNSDGHGSFSAWLVHCEQCYGYVDESNQVGYITSSVHLALHELWNEGCSCNSVRNLLDTVIVIYHYLHSPSYIS